MKKEVKIIVCAFLLVLGLCGCSDGISASNLVEESSSNQGEYSVNKLLHEGVNIKLSCKKIMKTGIEFEIENLSDSEILVSLDIGLDGIRYKAWGDANDWTIGAYETKICTMNGDLTYVEHAYISLNGIVFVDGTGVEEFSICDVELGGKENYEIEFNEGIEQYSSDDLVVKYIDADAQGLNFYVENKRDMSITVGVDSFTMNGKEQIAGNVTTIPPHTKDIFSLDILSYNSDYFSNELKSFQGIMYTQIDGKGMIDRFPISYGEEKFAENQNSESMKQQENEKSVTEMAYDKACSLTINDLEKKTSSFSGTTHYYYNSLIIQTEDEEWLTESWNTEKSLNQGALYRTIASYLEGFSMGLNTGSDYSEIMSGVKWTSKDDFKPYVANASEFICAEDSFVSVIKKLETLSCVSGDFDYNNKKYHIVVSDLSQCADEMMISEQMLGYIFAMMEEYAPAFEFNGNSCVIDYEAYNG